MAKIIIHKPFNYKHFYDECNESKSRYYDNSYELEMYCEQSVLDTAFNNYDSICYRIKLLGEKHKTEVTQVIKSKANEIRDAGGDSELLIVSEMLQVQQGLIVGDQAIAVKNNFNTLSEYKNQAIIDYQNNKSNLTAEAEAWIAEDQVKYDSYLAELQTIADEKARLAEEQAILNEQAEDMIIEEPITTTEPELDDVTPPETNP